MSKVTIAILVDGLRHDYITKEDSPFLYSLAQTGISGSVKETFAFQLRPAFFAGLYPEDCDVAHLYYYDPKNSPFKFTKYLSIPSFLFNLPIIGTRGRAFIGKHVRNIEAKKGHTASMYYADTASIPYNMLRYFDFSEKYATWLPNSLPDPTLFDILIEHNKHWLWLGYPTDDQRTVPLLNKFKEKVKNNHSFIYLHFAELDWVGHSHGPHSQERKQVLREIDDAIKDIHSTLVKQFDEVHEVIFGDHGMAEIKKKIDLWDKLNKTKLKIGVDYIYFLDSTQVRFWFKNEKAKIEISNLLRNIPEGKILDQDDYAKFKFRFPHNKFGEIIFLANSGVLIYPNFFQKSSPALGMHGYDPNEPENQAALIVNSPKIAHSLKIKEPCEMVDIFPTILDLMQLPISTSCKGYSIIEINQIIKDKGGACP